MRLTDDLYDVRPGHDLGRPLQRLLSLPGLREASLRMLDLKRIPRIGAWDMKAGFRLGLPATVHVLHSFSTPLRGPAGRAPRTGAAPAARLGAASLIIGGRMEAGEAESWCYAAQRLGPALEAAGCHQLSLPWRRSRWLAPRPSWWSHPRWLRGSPAWPLHTQASDPACWAATLT